MSNILSALAIITAQLILYAVIIQACAKTNKLKHAGNALFWGFYGASAGYILGFSFTDLSTVALVHASAGMLIATNIQFIVLIRRRMLNQCDEVIAIATTQCTTLEPASKIPEKWRDINYVVNRMLERDTHSIH